MPKVRATILHVANFSHRAKGAGFTSLQYKLTNGLIRAGHNVVCFSDRDVARAATPLLSRKAGRAGANRKLLALARTLRPDVVLFGHADTIDPTTLAALRDLLPCVRMAQWNVDPLFEPDNVDRLRSKIELVDWTFVTTGGPMLRGLGGGRWNVAYLPNAVDISIERGRAFAAEPLTWDVLYAVGSPSFLRHHCGTEMSALGIVRDLRTRVPGCRFLTPGIDHPHFVGTPAAATLCSARMGLNISRRNDVHWYSSDRLAHLAGNGLLVMTERASGFGELFAEDEMAFYGSVDELAAQIERFLGDSRAREATARRGWRAYHRMFDSTRVAAYMMAVLDGRVDPWAFDWRSDAERAVGARTMRFA